MYNHGQNCSAGSRVFVHRKHYETVVNELVKMANNVKLGAGMEKETEMGPLVSQKQQERVLHYIEQGKQKALLLLLVVNVHLKKVICTANGIHKCY